MPDRLSICAYPPKIAENGMQIMFPVAYFMFKREPILWYHPYMLEKDILLIINPNASKGKGRKRAHDIRDLFKAKGRQCTVAYTNEPGHAERLAAKGMQYGYREIIAAGGDGTVNEVLNGIMKSGNASSVAMGIIPIGRGNDFAWAAGIPRDMEKAVGLILSRSAVPVDVGIARGPEHPEGMYFLNGTGIGFEPMVNFRASEYRHLNGMPSYIMAFMDILRRFPDPYHLQVDIDDREFSLDTQQFSVLNGRRMGSAFVLGPKARIDDGYFDVMYVRKPVITRSALISAVACFLRGSHVEDTERFVYMNARKIRLQASGDVMQIHCDGEEFSRSGRWVECEILPGALRLYKPAGR